MSRPTPPTLAGWGLLERPGVECRSEDLAALTRGAVLTRGLGRSYGDSSLPPPGTLDVAGSVLADRVLAFNPETGVLRAEAGFSLNSLNRLFLHRGFFSPVTPGTSFVTLGGAVASDVHGKNHHRDGCFGEHVRALKLRVADGQIVECSPTVEPELFRATLGGMGLTGHVLEVEFQLARVPSPWIVYESERVPDVDAYVDALKAAAADWPMTVGWIDCLSRGKNLGRGILIKGRWAEAHEAPPEPPRTGPKLAIPFLFPSWALNPLSIRAFNFLYYWKHWQRRRAGLMTPDAFFYPLDGILHWNRIYGRRGFTQYQCVLPDAAGRGAARRFMDKLTALGGASFLCVIKDCGPEGTGLLSFPLKGISIAVDMALTDRTQGIVDALNAFVIAEGGRIYLSKDAFTRPEDFRRMEPRLDAFLAVRRKWDPERRIRSAQSVRLLGDGT
ncbi:MAG: FAD-binding oxidoreductase [Deltaproteobacteria bacterium]|nr:FAD-binding oxidoreductase [Deltaproteobacteria bacterium]